MVNGGWLPPGRSGDPLRWQLDLQKGWLPPGQIGNPSGVQFEMPIDFDPSQRDAGYQFLHSPAGVAAPLHSINWTPGPGKGEVHGPGVQAPIDKPNISVLPVGAATTPWRDQLAQMGSVGGGQAGGGINPEDDWRRASILNDPGGLYVGMGQDPLTSEQDAELKRQFGGQSAAPTTGDHYQEWEDVDGNVWRLRVHADESPVLGADGQPAQPQIYRRATPDEIAQKHAAAQIADVNQQAAVMAQNEKVYNLTHGDPADRRFETHAEREARLGRVAVEQRAQEDQRLQREAAERTANPKPTPTLVQRPQEGGGTKTFSVVIGPDGKLVSSTEVPELASPPGAKPATISTRPQPDGGTKTFAIREDPKDPSGFSTTEIPSLATSGTAKPPQVVNTDEGGKIWDPKANGGQGSFVPAPGLPASRPKAQQVGNRLVRENPQTGAFEEVYHAPANWGLTQVGNKLIAFNPETTESRLIAETPEPIRQMGSGIFLVPAGQTLKITGTKGGDRMVSGGPKEGWPSQGSPQTATTSPSSDPTKASTAPSPSAQGGQPSAQPSPPTSSPSSSTPSSSTSSAASASAPQGTSSGPQGLSLFGTESPRTQQDFLAAVGGDRAKAEEMWNRQHQGEIDEIVRAGRDPMTTRSVQDVRSPMAATDRVPPTAGELDAAVRTMTGRHREDVGGWAPVTPGVTHDPNRPGPDNPPWMPMPNTSGTTLEPIRPGPNNPPPWIPPSSPDLLQQMGLATVGWGQAAPPQPPMGSVAAGPETGWQPPLDPSQVVGGGNKFGDQVSMEGTHMGTDLQAFKGTPAMSPVDGQVVAVKNEPSGLGLQVSIRDASGQIHTLAHLDNASVRQGDQVRMGQPVAAVGESGAGATGPHLDYRIAGQDGTPINPEPRMGQLAQLPPHPNTVGEGQAKKGWTPKVGKGQTLDASIWQAQMDQQASQFSQSLSMQKQGLANQMAIAKMEHEVAMKNAQTAQDQERENERFNYTNQILTRYMKLIDEQISYAQMASSQNIVKMQIAGQLTATGMNNETAVRVADIQTSAQLAGIKMTTENAMNIAELEARTKLQTEGTFGQRTTADLLKTSLTNPWLQQLSGMAPGYGAPGGPGASGGGGTGGILQPLLQGWNAEVPSGNVIEWGGGMEGNGGGGGSTDWGALYQGLATQPARSSMYTDWLDPSRLDPISAQSLYPKGLTTSQPRLEKHGIPAPENYGSGQAGVGRGQGVGDQLAQSSPSDVATWGPYATQASSTAGWGGWAPIGNAPPVPTWQQWQAMSPFEKASYRALATAAEPWPLAVQQMRIKWGQEGGPTAAPATTQLGAMTREPLDRMSISQNAEVFGEDPQMYWTNQQKEWSKSDQSSAPQLVT